MVLEIVLFGATVILGGVAVAIAVGSRRINKEILPLLISGPKTGREMRDSVRPPEARKSEAWYDEMCDALAEDELVDRVSGRWRLTLKGRRLAARLEQTSSSGSAS